MNNGTKAAIFIQFLTLFGMFIAWVGGYDWVFERNKGNAFTLGVWLYLTISAYAIFWNTRE